LFEGERVMGWWELRRVRMEDEEGVFLRAQIKEGSLWVYGLWWLEMLVWLFVLVNEVL
jgi:hypothetical protein